MGCSLQFVDEVSRLPVDETKITSVLRERIAAYEQELKVDERGTVISVGDGIARVYGLEKVMAQELVEFPGGVMGIALNLEEDIVGCILLGPDENIEEGDVVRRTGRIAETEVGAGVWGRVMTPLAEPLDDPDRPIRGETTRPLEVKAPGVIKRQPVNEPLYTGIKAIDALTPIGRGQRELIIGDRQTGKTALAVDTIINQRDTDVSCIYVAIGQKISTVRRIAATLEQYGAMEHTCIIAACASDPAALQYIAPYAGCTIGEYERDNGRNALIVYDDLSKHAVAYRELSLLLERPPGREAYPGDIFNLHSRLLERAAKMSDEEGGGSLTALPIVETQEGDFSAYIPTNIISITDGQIYLQPELFHQGVRPAINVGLSVSRVGGAAQPKMMRQVAGELRSDLATYRESEAFTQFAEELDAHTQQILRRGQRMVEVLKQPQYVPMAIEDQVIAIFAGTEGHWDKVPTDAVAQLEDELLEFIHKQYPEIIEELHNKQQLEKPVAEALTKAIERFKAERQSEEDE